MPRRFVDLSIYLEKTLQRVVAWGTTPALCT